MLASVMLVSSVQQSDSVRHIQVSILFSKFFSPSLLYIILSSVTCAMGFPGGSAGKESTCSAGDLGSIPGLGRSPEEWNSYPLQYSSLENAMDCIAHGVAKN